MVSVIFCILSLVVGAFASAIITRLRIRTDVVGELTVVEQEGEENTMLLGIYKGRLNEIQEGKVVRLLVTKEKFALKSPSL